MQDYEIFELKQEHVTLLSNTYITWNNVETGAPEINPKRPYGNSYVLRDITKILGAEKEDDDYSDEEYNFFYQLHYETEYALSVILETKQFTPGIYIRKRFSGNWEMIDKPQATKYDAIDLNIKIEKTMKEQNGPYKLETIKELERLGLDGNKLIHFDYNELTRLLERRRIHYRQNEEKRLDKIIEDLLIKE